MTVQSPGSQPASTPYPEQEDLAQTLASAIDSRIHLPTSPSIGELAQVFDFSTGTNYARTVILHLLRTGEEISEESLRNFDLDPESSKVILVKAQGFKLKLNKILEEALALKSHSPDDQSLEEGLSFNIFVQSSEGIELTNILVDILHIPPDQLGRFYKDYITKSTLGRAEKIADLKDAADYFKSIGLNQLESPKWLSDQDCNLDYLTTFLKAAVYLAKKLEPKFKNLNSIGTLIKHAYRNNKLDILEKAIQGKR